METFLGFSDFRHFWHHATMPKGRLGIRAGGWTHFVRESMSYMSYSTSGFFDRIKFWFALPSKWIKFNKISDAQ